MMYGSECWCLRKEDERRIVVIRVPLEGQTKESARRYVIYCVALYFYCVAVDHMFLLCGAPPYVSIMCPLAICFYCVRARPYVSIGLRSAICLYYAYDHMFSWATVMSHTICSPLQWNRRLVT